MEYSKSEDCLIFYAFTPKYTKFRQVSSAVLDFMKNKQATDPSDRFNFVVYLKDGPNYLDHFVFDPIYIMSTLKSLNKDIVRANLAGGIFIAITFIIEVYKKISQKFFRLVILADSATYEIPDDYLPALEELIKKVKDMPFFIDIMLIGSPYSDKAQKLLRLANLANGELYGIRNVKRLNSVLKTLSEKKYVSDPSFVKKIRTILPENEQFYINLADNPSKVDNRESCSICFQKDDHSIVKCPSCDTVTHEVCWAQWAETTNIGIPHVFRCHNCFNILTLDKNYVIDVQKGKIPTIADLNKMKKKDIISYLHEIETKSHPKIVHKDDPMVVGDEYSGELPLSIQEEELRKKTSHIKICPNCSKIMIGDKKNCPSCGFSLF
ncbi:MAG: hypothetical protein ACW96S_03810 [Promethearchaeota archaeon]|jgi:rubrerythrin